MTVRPARPVQEGAAKSLQALNTGKNCLALQSLRCLVTEQKVRQTLPCSDAKVI